MIFKAIQDSIESDSKLPEIPRKTLLCTVEGQTIFSLFFKEIRVYEQITKQLKEIDFEVEDDQGQMDKLFLSRVIQMTEVPTRWYAVESEVNAVEKQSRFKSFIKWIYQLTSVKQSADVLTGC